MSWEGAGLPNKKINFTINANTCVLIMAIFVLYTYYAFEGDTS